MGFNIFSQLIKIVLSKIMKNFTVKYLLVMYFGRKSNLGHQINYQGSKGWQTKAAFRIY